MSKRRTKRHHHPNLQEKMGVKQQGLELKVGDLSTTEKNPASQISFRKKKHDR